MGKMHRFSKMDAVEGKLHLVQLLASTLKDVDSLPTIYTVVTWVGRGFLSRKISLYIVVDGDIRRISHLVAKALELPLDLDYQSVYVRGGGEDMGYHLVDKLSRALYGKSYHLNHKWL